PPLTGAGPRAARAGRDFVTPEEVKAVAVATLAHRLILRPELWVRRVRTEDVAAALLEQRPTAPPPCPGVWGRGARTGALVAELLEQVPTPPPEAEPAAVRSRQGS